MNPKCYKSAILIGATANIFAALVGYLIGGNTLNVAEFEAVIGVSPHARKEGRRSSMTRADTLLVMA